MEIKEDSQKENTSPEISDVITGINNEKCCSEPLNTPPPHLLAQHVHLETAKTTKAHFTQEI